MGRSMTAQPNFFDGPFVAEFNAYRNTKIGQAAERFDRENPHVYELLKRFAKQVKDRGRARFGIAAIYERVRWEVAIETNDGEFKLSNNHRAYYSRKLMAQYPDLEGLFQTKENRA